MCTAAASRLAVALEGPWGQEGGFRVCVRATGSVWKSEGKCLEMQQPGSAGRGRMLWLEREARGRRVLVGALGGLTGGGFVRWEGLDSLRRIIENKEDYVI